jgi:hypothetical protein
VTFWELNELGRAAAHVRDQEFETRRVLSIAQAWNTARYSKAKRLPSLRGELNPPPRELSVDDQERLKREHDERVARMITQK